MNKSAEDYLNELPYRITRTIERKCPHCKKLCLKLKYSMNLFWICPHLNIKFSEWFPEVYRVMKSGTHIYFMINSRNYKDL